MRTVAEIPTQDQLQRARSLVDYFESNRLVSILQNETGKDSGSDAFKSFLCRLS